MGVGIGDNMNGLVWVMEWTSVLVIVLRIPKKEKPGKIQENKEEERRNKRSRYKVSCFHLLIVLKTN